MPGLTTNAQCTQKTVITTADVSQQKAPAIKSKLPEQKSMGVLPYPVNEVYVDAVNIFPAYVSSDNKVYYDNDISQNWNYSDDNWGRDITITKTDKENLFNKFRNKNQINPMGWVVIYSYIVDSARPVSLSWNINGQQLDKSTVDSGFRYYQTVLYKSRQKLYKGRF